MNQPTHEELLEALEELEHLYSLGAPANARGVINARVKARAAIAKARGES